MTRSLSNSSQQPRPSLATTHCLLLLAAVLATCRTGAASSQRQYYASIPRLGLVRGLTWSPGDSSATEQPPDGVTGSASGHNQQQQVAAVVVAFLGLSYAAPPVGLLRFMPPGAVSPSVSAAPIEQHQLMPVGQLVGVRDHSRFGHECVHLPDWLEVPGASARVRDRRRTQAEDCLNLNAFVPIHESASANSMRQQIKSNYPPGQAEQQANGAKSHPYPDQTTTISPGDHSNQRHYPVNQESETQDTMLRLWPLPLAQDDDNEEDAPKLPLLVIFHGQSPSPAAANTSNKPNSLDYLRVAQQTGSIVVTFNTRTGLLGFLPYSDEGVRRLNHAIWDQIGLLHWLKHNGAQALGADTRNVTLAAADEQAAHSLQLLVTSPHAKGLFNRVLLLRDERYVSQHSSPADGTDLLQLLTNQQRSPQEARDARRRLTLMLGQVVSQQVANHGAVNGSGGSSMASGDNRTVMDERQTMEFVQAAELVQLAQIDAQLRHLAPAPLLALAHEPTLDDRLLFPQLAALSRPGEVQAASQAVSHLRAQLDYCTYLRQLYSGQPDTLGLISAVTSSAVFSIDPSQATTGWRRDINSTESSNLSAPVHESTSQAATYFSHLRHLNHLSKVLANAKHNSSPDSGVLVRKRRRVPYSSERIISSNQPHEELEQLFALLASFDLMIGYIRSGNESAEVRAVIGSNDNPYQSVSKNYPKISNVLDQASGGIGRHMISSFRLADLHFVSTLASNSATGHYCDMFSPSQKLSKTNLVFLASPVSPLPITTSRLEGQVEPTNLLVEIVRDRASITSVVNEFIRFGSKNHTASRTAAGGGNKSLIDAYNSLDRRFNDFDVIEGHQRVDDNISNLNEKISVQLDLMPYVRGAKRAATHHALRVTDVIKTDEDLVSCLDDIELSLSRSSRIALMHEQAGCVPSLVSKLRNQLHQVAAKDLEPLLRAVSRQSQADSPRAASSITTRNLVTEDQASQQQQQHSTFQQRSTGVEESTPLSGAKQPAPLDNTKQSLIGLLKQASNRPLALIICSGLLIFLLNLIIVALIALRSAQTRRRVRGQQDQQQALSINLDLAPTSQPRPSVLSKKPALKRANLPATNGDQDRGGFNGKELHSAIKNSVSCNSLGRANKQLTFSLPNGQIDDEEEESEFEQQIEFGIPSTGGCLLHNTNHAASKSHYGETPSTFQSFARLEVDNEMNHFDHHHHQLDLQQQQQQQNQLTYLDTNNGELLTSDQSSELLLSATPILDSYNNSSNNTKQLVVGNSSSSNPMSGCEWSAGGTNYDPVAYIKSAPYNSNTNKQHQCSQQRQQNNSNSPLGYLSQSTTTTSGTYRELGRRADGSVASTSGGRNGRLHFTTSQHSLESLTTLSVTPLQLESYAPNTNQMAALQSQDGSSSAQQQAYQLEPIGLIYQQAGSAETRAPIDQQQTMLMLDTETGYCFHHHHHHHGHQHQSPDQKQH